MLPGTHRHFHRIVQAQLKRVRWKLALGALCIVGTSLALLAAPWPIKLVFDHVLGMAGTAALQPWPGVEKGSMASLALLSGVLVAIAVVAGLCGYGQQVLTSRIGYEIVYTLRGALFDHVQSLSLAFHSRARTGELMSRITSDTNTLRDVYSEYVLLFLTHVITVTAMLAVLLVLDWRLGLLTALTFPVLFVLMVRRLQRVKSSARLQRSNEGRLAGRVAEMLSSVALVKAFGREATERDRFNAESQQSIEESIRTTRAEARASRLVEVVTAAGTGVVLLAGGGLALRGTLTPGDLLVFITYVGAMYKPVKNLARLSARMSRAQASVERIDDILAMEPEADDAPDAIEAGTLRGDIAFEQVSLEVGGQSVLSDVSFRIPAGCRAAIVGPSGAGKSTLVRLLLRLANPSGGCITVDGVDIRKFRRTSLRQAIGVVLQDTLLVGSTVRDNIAYGKVDATDAEVEAAARDAQAHEFIVGLPDGYGHVLGPGGATLSGGQRQRLCLARALVKRPAILVLDEPTSSVDAQAGQFIHATLTRLQRGRTTLIVAHQWEAVADVDWVIVMSAGRVVEQGTPDQLRAAGGACARLFRLGLPATEAA
jgi:ATP-binding cassette, subfamily B, bacterial